MSSLGKNDISPARPEPQKSLRSIPPGAIIDAVDGQDIVQTSAQALEFVLRYIPRSPYGPSQQLGILAELLVSPARPKSEKSQKSVQNDPRDA